MTGRLLPDNTTLHMTGVESLTPQHAVINRLMHNSDRQAQVGFSFTVDNETF